MPLTRRAESPLRDSRVPKYSDFAASALRTEAGWRPPGVHYLVNHNLEVSVRVGWGLNDQSSLFFSKVGVGWRF